MEEKTKNFDCVEMKHKGAEKVQKQIRGMTREEELGYWKQGTEELRTLQNSLQSTVCQKKK